MKRYKGVVFEREGRAKRSFKFYFINLHRGIRCFTEESPIKSLIFRGQAKSTVGRDSVVFAGALFASYSRWLGQRSKIGLQDVR